MRDGLGLGREPDESHNGCGSQNRGRPLGSVVITVSSSAEDFLLIPFVETLLRSSALQASCVSFLWWETPSAMQRSRLN